MYYCTNCAEKYDKLTQDGCCSASTCFGEPLIEISGDEDPNQPPPSNEIVEGLCILVCDISASMNEPAFASSPAPKLKLVVGAIQRAIAELKGMAKADTAYIAIVAFGQKAGLIKWPDGTPFFKSVTQIINEFGDRAERLPDYLYPLLHDDHAGFGRGETDITAGLKSARLITDCMLRRDLSPIGVTASAHLIEHADIITKSGQQIEVPNIRVMVYSDGAHNSTIHRALTSDFDDLSPSPLMTAFLGDGEGDSTAAKGIEEMRRIANTCPEHGLKGFFLIDRPERHAVLRNLFRMASGASGFCEQCLNRDILSFETERG